MLKKFFLLTVFILLSSNLFAHGQQFLGTAIIKKAKWSPVQISIWPVHLCSMDSTIYGLNLSPGLLGICGKIYGISCGGFVFIDENNGLAANIYSYGDENNGVALGVFNEWRKNNGAAIALANFVEDEMHGRNTLQIGVFNQAYNGLQIGLLNYNPNAMIPWTPVVNWVIPRSVESSLKILKQRPYPFDQHIETHANKYFPNWNQAERLHWLNELFPMTDAGATTALMEVARKYDLLLAWDDYALTLPVEERKRLRYCLGIEITQKYWYHYLETSPDGTCTLNLGNIRTNGQCSFSAKFKNLPTDTPVIIRRENSDLRVGYPIEKTIKTNNSITQISDFVTLFVVRRDAETDLWYETGSWQEVDQKTPAVTTYKEKWENFVCIQIKDNNRIFKEFTLKDQYRKIKLGRLKPDYVQQTPVKL